jgi:hypothetical protein
MTIRDLITLLEARMVELRQQRATVAGLGDIPAILRIDTELAETEATLATIRALG